MRSKIRHLKILDKTLKYISEKPNSKVAEKELFGEVFIDNSNIEYLLEKKYVTRTKTPVMYLISKKGKLFISRSSFVSEYKKSIFDRFINSTHLIVSTVVLLLSFLFTYYSKKQNSKSIDKLEINISQLSSKIDTLKTNQQLQKDSIEKLKKRYDELNLKIGTENSQPITKK